MIDLRLPLAHSTSREIHKDMACLLLLGVVCLSFFWRLITPFPDQRMFMAAGDFTSQFYPYQHFLSSEIHQGRIPLWNPYILAGHPVAADTQASVTYPVALLLGFVLGRDGLTLVGAEWEAVIHYFMAAVFTYFFVKRLTKQRTAALLSAIAFSFSGYLLSYPGEQAPILETAIWLPLILFFVHRGTDDQRGWVPNLCFAGAVQGIAVLAGHPQTAMFLFYATLLYILYLAYRTHFPLRALIAGCICFVVFFLTTSAVQIIPVLEFLPLSTRDRLPYDAASYGFGFSSALGVILPDWRNEKSLYIGILPLLLALFAIARRAPDFLFWGGLALVSLVLSFGGQTPLFPILFTAVPGFSMFKDQERIAIVFVFAMAVLAGYGVALVGSWQVPDLRRHKLLAVLLAIFAISALVPFLTQEWQASASFKPGSYAGVFSGYYLFVLLSIVSFLLLVLLARSKVPDAMFRVLMLALVILDLFAVNWNNNIVSYAADSYYDDAVSAMQYLKSQPGVFRIRLEHDEVLPSNYPAMFGLAHMGGDTPIRIRRVQDLLEAASEWRMWQLFNVDYVVTRQEFKDGVEVAYRTGSLNTYKVLYGLPRAYAVTQFRVANNQPEALESTMFGKNHPGDLAILEENPVFVSPSSGAKRPSVDIVDYSSRNIKITTNGDVDAMLVVSDAYYPGWKATIDGNPTKIYVADYAFRAVELPKGQHVVEMAYDPSSFKLGAIISLVSWSCIGILALLEVRSIRKKQH